MPFDRRLRFTVIFEWWISIFWEIFMAVKYLQILKLQPRVLKSNPQLASVCLSFMIIQKAKALVAIFLSWSELSVLFVNRCRRPVSKAGKTCRTCLLMYLNHRPRTNQSTVPSDHQEKSYPSMEQRGDSYCCI